MEGEVLGTDVPEWVHGNKGFDVSYHGGGAKLQYFFSPKQRGAFVGARTEITRMRVKLQAVSKRNLFATIWESMPAIGFL